MDRQKFKKACARIISPEREQNDVVLQHSIGTLGEKTLHAVLKLYFEPDIPHGFCRDRAFRQTVKLPFIRREHMVYSFFLFLNGTKHKAHIYHPSYYTPQNPKCQHDVVQTLHSRHFLGRLNLL